MAHSALISWKYLRAAPSACPSCRPLALLRHAPILLLLLKHFPSYGLDLEKCSWRARSCLQQLVPAHPVPPHTGSCMHAQAELSLNPNLCKEKGKINSLWICRGEQSFGMGKELQGAGLVQIGPADLHTQLAFKARRWWTWSSAKSLCCNSRSPAEGDLIPA